MQKQNKQVNRRVNPSLTKKKHRLCKSETYSGKPNFKKSEGNRKNHSENKDIRQKKTQKRNSPQVLGERKKEREVLGLLPVKRNYGLRTLEKTIEEIRNRKQYLAAWDCCIDGLQTVSKGLLSLACCFVNECENVKM